MKREELMNDNSNSSSHFLNNTVLTYLVLNLAVEQWISRRRPWLWNGIHITVRGDRILSDSNQNYGKENGDRDGWGSFRGGHQGNYEEAMSGLRSELLFLKKQAHRFQSTVLHTRCISPAFTSSLSRSFSDLSPEPFLLPLTILYSF